MKTMSVLYLLLGLSAIPLPAAEETAAPVSEVNLPNLGASKMTGSYVGMFGDNKINVTISKVIGSTVIGYSVVAGNERAFSGAFTEEGAHLKLTAKEPGDHPEDGVFSFDFNTTDNTLGGSWTPNNKTLAAKTFTLLRRDFKYDPSLGFYPQASNQKLTEADVENMPSEDLRLMRNEIYARHGYSFRLKEMREYFDTQEWYMPVSTDVINTLTKTEWANEILIKRYEKYAKENYDSYGR